MHKYLSIACVLLMGGCATTGAINPPDSLRPIAFYICVDHAVVTIKGPGIGPANDEGLTVQTQSAGIASFVIPAKATALNLFINAPGYESYGQVVRFLAGTTPKEFFTPDCQPNVVRDQIIPGVVAVRAFPAEAGALRVVDRHFELPNGQVWSWRGSSMFLLYARWVTGQDITPQLNWMKATGVNVARVFDLNGNPDWNLAAYGVADPGPPNPTKLGEFFDLMASNGLRVEYVPLTSRGDMGAMRAAVQQAYDVAAGRWNVFIEVCNECENNGIDPVAVAAGLDRHAVLSASGMDPGRHCDAQANDGGLWAACMRREVLVFPEGYLTAHDLMRDANHSPRNTKDFTIDFAGVFRVPIVADEHVGVIDLGYPNYVYEGDGFAHHTPDGGGRRTTDCAVITSAAGIEHLFGPGFTIHLQAGLEGRAPRADEPIQTACSKALTAVWQFIPPQAQLGAYRAPHISDFPLTWTSGDSDSLVQHGYCSSQGSEAWCVIPMPRPGMVLAPSNGYTIDVLGPFPGMAHLTR